MIKRQVLSDGRYVVLTTRRADYVTYIFGKATIYKSKESYDKGNLLADGWETVTNIPLGNTKAEMITKIDEFIASLEVTEPALINPSLPEPAAPEILLVAGEGAPQYSFEIPAGTQLALL